MMVAAPGVMVQSENMIHLPDEGGVNDQSAWLLDAFSVIGAALRRLRKEANP